MMMVSEKKAVIDFLRKNTAAWRQSGAGGRGGGVVRRSSSSCCSFAGLLRRQRRRHDTVSCSKKRRFSAFSKRKEEYRKEIEALPEYRASMALDEFLREKVYPSSNNISHPSSCVRPPTPPSHGYRHMMSTDMMNVTLDAAMAAFCLHLEARIASLVGMGFYTIGPCGEETLSSAALALQDQDSVALHYRHVGINIARQLQADRDDSSMQQVLLDRARGFTVSRLDPVTGGVHCSIGSSKEGGNNYIVTSTLASQCPSAVGRALGYSLAAKASSTTNNSSRSNDTTSHTDDSASSSKNRRPVSFVTVGDGSVHNHHFWSAFHLARHARHQQIKCPVVFGIADNGLSISYSTNGYCDTLFSGNDSLVPLFRVDNAQDMMQVYDQTLQAVEYSRKNVAPSVLLYSGLVRRFGHAATDRQSAYLTQEQIQAMAEMTLLEECMVQAVEIYSATSWSDLYTRFDQIQQWTRSAFEQASEEEKVTRQDMLNRVSATPIAVPRLANPNVDLSVTTATSSKGEEQRQQEGKREVMRKHMTHVIEEVMEADQSVVYIGEDVEHGGYYLVTQGLADKFQGRVIDFPPDETSLLGAAMGFAQVGLTPIVEIPYAKYLDCGADMFYEIAVMHWLSNGQCPNGMLIRLQGFDRGVFGGNFHTHNMLPHMPPGVDVVCYSNGEDYVRGFRHAMAQAKAGRVVMSVDCTDLLNKRHLYGSSDRGWERIYPPQDDNDTMMGFDDIRCYRGSSGSSSKTPGKHAIVTYGNGVVTALQSRASLLEKETDNANENEIDVIDCPYLSGVPLGLKEILPRYEKVLFADICKDSVGSGGVLSSNTVMALHREGLLPRRTCDWALVSAPRCYNPLGSTVTFLNVDDIVAAYEGLVDDSKDK